MVNTINKNERKRTKIKQKNQKFKYKFNLFTAAYIKSANKALNLTRNTARLLWLRFAHVATKAKPCYGQVNLVLAVKKKTNIHVNFKL